MVTFRNRRSSSVLLIWIDFDGKEKPYATIAPRSAVEQPTYVRHLWVLRDARNNREIKRFFARSRTPVTVDIR